MKHRHIFPVPASERPHNLYTFYVTGRGYFPVDMLRYDNCWPCSGDDAADIADAIGGYAARASAEVNRQRCIRLRSYREPTIGRWSSFGWSVSADKLED